MSFKDTSWYEGEAPYIYNLKRCDWYVNYPGLLVKCFWMIVAAFLDQDNSAPNGFVLVTYDTIPGVLSFMVRACYW